MGVKLQSALGGSVELNAPSTASNFTMTVPAGNGTVATTDQLQNFRNRLINGDFTVWQKGTSRYSNSGVGGVDKYYADRWTSGQYQNAAFERVERTGTGPTSKYAMRVSSSSSAEASAGTRITIGQMVEHINCSDLAGKQVTLSFWIRFSAASFPNYGNFYYQIWENDAVDPNFDTTGADRTIQSPLTNGSLPTTWTKYTVTGTTASTMKNIVARFGFETLATTASNGSLWYELAEVQLEAGPTATPFERRPYGLELSLCQRYYERIPANAAGSLNISSVTQNVAATSFWKVTKRVNPSTSIGTGAVQEANTNSVISYQNTSAGGWYFTAQVIGAAEL